MKICKELPVSPNPRISEIEFNFLIIIPGIYISTNIIPPEYPRTKLRKFMLKILVPAIPVIPGILYILLLLLHLLRHYTSDNNNKMKFQKTFTVYDILILLHDKTVS
jgi:hypothetical protein